MEGNGEVDDVQALRARLVEYDRLWRSASPRLAAFARLEELAEAQGTTPEALARQAAVARTQARLAELHGEVEALQASSAHLAVEVTRLEQERSEAVRRYDEVQRQLEFVGLELQRRTGDRQTVERELGAMLALRDQRSQEIAELTQSRDDLYLEVAELLEGIEDIQGGVGGVGTGLRSMTEHPAAAGGKITAEQFADDSDLSGFDEFFNADIGHDKSRDWILRDSGTSASS